MDKKKNSSEVSRRLKKGLQIDNDTPKSYLCNFFFESDITKGLISR